MRRPAWLLPLGAVALLLAALVWLLATPSGLGFALRVADAYGPGRLVAGRHEGRLLGPLRLEQLAWEDGGRRLRVQSLELDWSPSALLRGRLQIDRLRIHAPRLVLPAPDGAAGPAAVPEFRSPLRVDVDALVIDQAEIRRGDRPPLRLVRLDLAAWLAADELRIRRLGLATDGGRLSLRGRLGLSAQAATDVAAELAARAGDRDWALALRLQGDRSALAVETTLSAPAKARLAGRIERPLEAPRFDLALDLAETPLSALGDGLPPDRLAAGLRLRGSPEALRLDGRLLPGSGPLAAGGPVTLSVTAARQADGAWALRPARLAQAGARIELEGRVGADGAFTGDLAWTDLAWPPAAPGLRSPEGRLGLSARLPEYRFEGGFALTGAGLPEGRWALAGSGSGSSLVLERLAIDTLGGRITGEGRLAFAEGPAGGLSLAWQGLDPGRQWPDWPGRLSGRARLTFTAGGEILALEAVQGELRGRALSGRGRLSRLAGVLRAERLELAAGDNRLRVDGRLGEQAELDWELAAADLSALAPGWAGRLDGRGRITGGGARMRLSGELQGESLAGGGLRIAALGGRFGLSPGRPEGPLAGHLELEGVRFGGRRLDRVRLDLEGRTAAHHATLQAEGPGHRLQAAARGGWERGGWRGWLDRLDGRLPEAGEWVLAAPVALAWSPARLDLAAACWRQAAARLCLEPLAADLSQGSGSTGFRLSDWPLAGLDPWLQPGVDLEGSLSADGHLAWRPGGLEAEAALRVPPGALRWGGPEARESLAFEGLAGRFRLRDGRVRAEARLALGGSDALAGRVDARREGAAWRLDGGASLSLARLEFLAAFAPALAEPQGRVEGALRIAGTADRPRLQGRLTLSGGSALLVPLGIRLADVGLRLEGDPGGGYRLDGELQSGGGRLAVAGELAPPGAGGAWSGELRLAGENFLAVDTREASARISPDLRLGIEGRELRLSGSVTVPQARLAPHDYEGAVAPTRDLVRLDVEGDAEPRWRIHSRLRLVLGEDVRFEGFGFKARLDGTLDLSDEPRRTTRARGQLLIHEGTYTAYGQVLNIESGRLLFAGGPIDDPAVDVRAIRKTGEVTAGVEVGGTLQAPELELFSTPAMPQGDVLSYLLVGRPLSGASAAQGQLLAQAAASLGFKGGNLIAERIAGTFGLDELSVAGGDGAANAALVIGKYLSPRLYIGYSVGLFEALSRFRLRYTLSRHLTLQTEAGASSGADLLWSIER